MIRYCLIIIITMLLSCSSSEIIVTDPVTGASGIVQKENFYKGIAYIRNDLSPLFLKYYKQNNDIPKNLNDFQSVVGSERSDNLSERYCTINTKNMGAYAYISITMHNSQNGCTNPIFWDVTLNEEQRRKEQEEQFEKMKKDLPSFLEGEMNSNKSIPIPLDF